MDFHTMVLMVIGNLMLTMVGQPVSDVLAPGSTAPRSPRSQWNQVDVSHIAIIDHIARGEAAEAEEVVRSYLRDLYDETWRGREQS